MSTQTITTCDHCGECNKGSGMEFSRFAITQYGNAGPSRPSMWIDLCSDCLDEMKKLLPRAFDNDKEPLRYSDGFGGVVEA